MIWPTRDCRNCGKTFRGATLCCPDCVADQILGRVPPEPVEPRCTPGVHLPYSVTEDDGEAD